VSRLGISSGGSPLEVIISHCSEHPQDNEWVQVNFEQGKREKRGERERFTNVELLSIDKQMETVGLPLFSFLFFSLSLLSLLSPLFPLFPL
jgi:hypothetical protein